MPTTKGPLIFLTWLPPELGLKCDLAWLATFLFAIYDRLSSSNNSNKHVENC